MIEKPNENPFGSKSNGKLSPRSYSIQFERKWKSIFLKCIVRGTYWLSKIYPYTLAIQRDACVHIMPIRWTYVKTELSGWPVREGISSIFYAFKPFIFTQTIIYNQSCPQSIGGVYLKWFWEAYICIYFCFGGVYLQWNGGTHIKREMQAFIWLGVIHIKWAAYCTF